MKKIIIRMLMKLVNIDDELLDNSCNCDVCNMIRKALGLLNLEDM